MAKAPPTTAASDMRPVELDFMPEDLDPAPPVAAADPADPVMVTAPAEIAAEKTGGLVVLSLVSM